ncbi:hypothetical protein ANAPC3_01371 [Anaplasma phagocytophilum]|nr:hypothetical protein ANAPC3_01371 [Anaplasma phagocytophilum]
MLVFWVQSHLRDEHILTQMYIQLGVSLFYTFEHRIAFLRIICGAGLFCYARPEGRRQKAEGRRQKAEGRRQKAEGRRQKRF